MALAGAALLLMALALPWAGQRRLVPAGEPKQGGADAAVDLTPFLDQVAAGEPVNAREVADRVDFRVIAAPQLPDGYCLEGCCLCRDGCCDLVRCQYRREGQPLLVFQSGSDWPVRFGNRPVLDTQMNGKPARVVQCDRCLAASWKAKGTTVCMVGPRDLSELVRLMAFVDRRLDGEGTPPP
jgi:hypothetical protein